MEIPRAALAGSSWSGGFAVAYAQRHPEQVTLGAGRSTTQSSLRGLFVNQDGGCRLQSRCLIIGMAAAPVPGPAA
ncbi:alpha/beta hydrolase [Streptomyces sp. RerS4]|uniref:alpha/beta fold hydrolase n=1 Tax=Streptomyces sp. RerS4 TaxID=2942449 RepID=UPI00201BC835|nr:alpha/beta hydrolase [Streptomyces sp. RerS4]UQX01059.1 alpha/beta hydrolase [Streptomyces sp. RerS4]